MKTIQFYAATNRSGNLLHIETDGCIVNIHVGLTDGEGRRVTRVDVLPEDESHPDAAGDIWHQVGPRVICEHPDGHDAEAGR